MKITNKKVIASTSTWTDDIICDICKRSCNFHFANDSDGSPLYNLEYATLSATWGYGPEWDGDIWESHVCAKCVKEKIMPIMRINFISYMYQDEHGFYENGEMYSDYGNYQS